MNSITRTGILALAGSIGVSLAATGIASAVSTPDQGDLFLSKRELSSMVLAVEDDDDGLDDDSRSRDNSYSRSAASNDGTNSRYTAVSRDRDRSWGDLTKDFTRDGGNGITRDWSRNHTNDSSRNDTRPR